MTDFSEAHDGFVAVNKDDAKVGTLYIEARIKDGVFCDMISQLQDHLANAMSLSNVGFDLLEDILASSDALDVLGTDLHETAVTYLQTLKVVEYVGPGSDTFFVLNEANLKVLVYHMYAKGRIIDLEDTQAEITSMPHVRFEGKWEELVFDTDLKGDLIWTIYNMLRFSADANQSDINPLILLHGPPGTGKTTLCHGFAQKIAVRLSDRYAATKLVEIKTATLLSKFFSESAKKVDEIFNTICTMCEKDSDCFVCVLIDEVESIAGSREHATNIGESQDSLRATNALLTGIDRVKGYSNIMIFGTSNFLESLDPAFLDRCGIRQEIKPPSTRSQYTILSRRLKMLRERGIIKTNIDVPTWDLAKIESLSLNESIGGKMFEILDLIKSVNKQRDYALQLSGRSLTQLPETAIMRYLRDSDCDLDLALQFILQQISASSPQTKTGRKGINNNENNAKNENIMSDGIQIRGKKRKLTILLEQDCDEEFLNEILDKLRGRKSELEWTSMEST